MADDWNTRIIEDFRAMVGKPKNRKVGDMFPHEGLVVLHTTGAKSGKEHVTPLAIWQDDTRVYVVGSAAGGPKHPAWFHNVLAHPDVTIEIGDETLEATAHNVNDRAERDRLYQHFIDMSSQFAEYEEKTGGRVIPVVAIEPVER